MSHREVSQRAVHVTIGGLAWFGALFCGVGPTHAQDDPSTVGASLHIEVDGGQDSTVGLFVTGYVTNGSRYRVGDVRLQVDGLDATGQRLEPAFGWVYGDVPAGGRAWFKVMVPRNAATRQVSIESFHLMSRDTP